MTVTGAPAPDTAQQHHPADGSGPRGGALGGLFGKDMRQWLRSPLQAGMGIAAPLLLLFMAAALFSPSGRDIPVAVLTPPGARGPYTQAFVRAVESRAGIPMHLKQTTDDPAEADRLLREERIFAVIGVPADFDRRLAHGERATVTLRADNAMEDMHKNVRLSFDRSLAAFYDSALGGQVHTRIAIRQTANEPPVSRAGYLAGGIVVYTALFTGLLYTATATAREWEHRTVDLLRVSGVRGAQVAAGKIAAGTLQALTAAAVVFGVASLFTDLRVHGSPSTVAGAVALTALLAAGLGAALGAAARKFHLIVPVAGVSSMVLWMLGGGFQYMGAARGTVLYDVNRWLPPSYAFDAVEIGLRHARGARLPFDFTVLGSAATAAVLLGALVLRRAADRRE